MNDPTRFDLDERQRAMLAEMGVRVWMPQRMAGADAPMPAPAPVVASSPPARVEAPLVAAPGPAASVDAPPPAAPATKEVGAVEAMDWPALQAAVAACRACALCDGRRQTVFGVGDRQAQWMVVGEAPGEQEDLQGEPFVGQAGQLLDNMLKAIGLSRQGEGAQGAYIANTLKCRPPANRNPEPEELAQCAPYLRRQVALLRPKIILAMGRFAVQTLLQTSEPIGRLRGQVHQYEGVPVIVTYHPAYLLRSPSEKARAWADLCLALDVMRRGAV